MDNMRLFYRGINAKMAVKKYNGFLPAVINQQVADSLCAIQAGNKNLSKAMIDKLKRHHLVIEKNSALYSTIPMLSCDLSLAIETEIKKRLDKDFAASSTIAKMAEKLADKWQVSSHVFVSQLVLGTMWFNMWLKLSDNKHNPVAVLIPDIDLNHVFYNEMYPILGNNVIVYWQSTLLGHPDTIYDILNDKYVTASIQSINEKFEFIPVGNALVLLKQLNMYKNRSDENKMPIPFIDLPKIDQALVKAVKGELQEVARVFYTNQQVLSEIAATFYNERAAAQGEVSYHNFRQMIYLVFSYCVVEAWLGSGLFPESVRIRDRKRKHNAPVWQIK